MGFGCMGLSGTYNDPVPEEVGISIIKHAFSQGITFFDTSDIYGPHANEVLVGKVNLLENDISDGLYSFRLAWIPLSTLFSLFIMYITSILGSTLLRLGLWTMVSGEPLNINLWAGSNSFCLCN